VFVNWQDFVLLVFSGALGGFLSGLLGVGGGIIFIPILEIVFRHYGLEADMVKYLLANSLGVIIFTGIFNSIKQYQSKNFFFVFILYTAIPGIAMVLLFSQLIVLGDWYNKKVFNLVFAAMLIPGLLRLFMNRKSEVVDVQAEPKKIGFVLTGMITGVFTAFSGLGGGVIMIPAFVNHLKLPIKVATSVSAGVVPFFALPSAIFYMFQQPTVVTSAIGHFGYILYPVIFPMVLGTLTTVSMGVKTGHQVKQSTVKIIFSVFVAVILIKILIENILY
jgi:uncharacterized membrane protein YfcA